VSAAPHLIALLQTTGLAAVPWDFALLLGVLAIFVPWRGVQRVLKLLRQPVLSSADRMMIYVSTIGVQWASAGIVWWRGSARGHSAGDWGLAVPDAAAAFSGVVVLLVLTCGLQILSLRRLGKLPPERHTTLGQLLGKLMPQGRTESLVFIALCVTAGICEEFIYRGFALTILERAAGGYVVAGVIASSALFSLAHLYQGRRGAASTFVLGGVFAVSRVLTGSLLPAIAAHTAVDLLAGLLGAQLLGARARIHEQQIQSDSK